MSNHLAQRSELIERVRDCANAALITVAAIELDQKRGNGTLANYEQLSNLLRKANAAALQLERLSAGCAPPRIG